jgi:hypothetical protein
MTILAGRYRSAVCVRCYATFITDPAGLDLLHPWAARHQDRDFDYLSPDISLAVWLAIDDATEANGLP